MKAESQQELRSRKIKSAFVIGAVGGTFWALVAYLFYFMNFTKVGPSIFANPFFSTAMADKPWTQFTGVAIIGLLSLGVALLYVFILSKYYSPWFGLGLGFVLFFVFFYGINPLLHLTEESIHRLGMNTFTTSFCLFLLYGLFIGFSLSAEFSSKEEKAK